MVKIIDHRIISWTKIKINDRAQLTQKSHMPTCSSFYPKLIILESSFSKIILRFPFTYHRSIFIAVVYTPNLTVSRPPSASIYWPIEES